MVVLFHAGIVAVWFHAGIVVLFHAGIVAVWFHAGIVVLFHAGIVVGVVGALISGRVPCRYCCCVVPCRYCCVVPCRYCCGGGWCLDQWSCSMQLLSGSMQVLLCCSMQVLL